MNEMADYRPRVIIPLKMSCTFFLFFFVSRFDSDVARNRRRLVQSNITVVISAISSMVKDGRKYEPLPLLYLLTKMKYKTNASTQHRHHHLVDTQYEIRCSNS